MTADIIPFPGSRERQERRATKGETPDDAPFVLVDEDDDGEVRLTELDILAAGERAAQKLGDILFKEAMGEPRSWDEIDPPVTVVDVLIDDDDPRGGAA